MIVEDSGSTGRFIMRLKRMVGVLGDNEIKVFSQILYCALSNTLA
jgi:hypothetical protein